MEVIDKNIVIIIIIALCILGNVSAIFAQPEEFIAQAKDFLNSAEGGGENNALSNYIRAMGEFNTNLFIRHQRAFDTILEKGWTGREKEEIEVLRSLQPILAEIWRGNEKPFVRYPPYEPLSSPVPNFLKLQLLGKLLVIQALYCEHINRPDYALEWYKHALMFAQRMCDKNSMLVGKLISLSVERNTLKSFQRFLVRQNFGKEIYQKIAEELAGLRSTETPVWQFIKTEDKYVALLINDPESALMLPGRKQPLTPREQQMIKFINANKESVRKQYREFSQKMEELLKKGYPEIIRTEQNTLKSGLPPFLSSIIPNFREASLREGITYAIWSLTIATARVRAYRQEKGTLPREISALGEVGMSLPDDPFSNQPLKYIFVGNRAKLYSIGPDLTDNNAKIEYDPTNGSVSTGDIIVAVR
ncbi:hypothetical protein J7M23_02145 [Candidatus Sumerlaeota bacterium]|nr:hypothetical protein [Candidatus Sumerlaeota bacterium]